MRIAKVRKLLEEKSLGSIVVETPIDLFYLTGLELSAGRLIIGREDATLYVDGRYLEVAQKRSPVPVVKAGGQCVFEAGPLGFDSERMTVAAYEKLRKEFDGQLVPLSHPIAHLRAIKEKGEVEKLRKAAELGSAGCKHVVSLLKEGVSERQLAAALEIFWKERGGERVSFDPIIAFGEGTSQPHYKVSDRKLKKGDPVLIDLGVVLDHYCSDMTRVVFFGEPDPKIKQVYTVVLEAQRAALALCHPNRAIKELDAAARGVIEERGFGEYFPHSLGHGIGLETHEIPLLRKTTEGVLEAGMCVTIEPGVYLPGFGGVRLEEMVVITESGYELLTSCDLFPERGA